MSKNTITVVLAKPDGWIKGVKYLPKDTDLKQYESAGFTPIAVKPDIADEIMSYPKIIFWDGSEFKKISDPRKIWKRLAANGRGGLIEPEYNHILKKISDDEIPFGDDNVNHPAIAGPSANKGLYKSVSGLPVEIQPGLVYRYATEDDEPVWTRQMVESGLYSEEQAWKTYNKWLAYPRCWLMVTEYKGEILQVENYQFSPNGFQNVYGGFASHVEKRSRWFWTVVSKSLFKALDKLRVEYIHSNLKAQYVAYAEYMKKTYNGVEYSQRDEKFIQLRVSVRNMASELPDWPERLSLGADWKYVEMSGGKTYLYREATEDEIQNFIPNYLSQVWESEGRERQDEIQTLFDKACNLDSATFLLGFIDDQISVVRYFCRQSLDDTDTLKSGGFNKLFLVDKTTSDIMFRGACKWLSGIGAKRFVQYIEKNQFITAKKLEAYQGVSRNYSFPKVIVDGSGEYVCEDGQKGDYIAYTTDIESYLAENSGDMK